MAGVLAGLEPEGVFKFFEEIASIPHGSYNVKAISDYLLKFAKDRGYQASQDEELNVLIKAPATKGLENAPTVILQGHMDMVCAKEVGFDFDFEKEGLRLKLDGDDISAEGTTLGGDDGIAVAYALAILDDKTIAHPALEVVITTQEEVGMEGAHAFDVSKLKGKYFINIDSEDEGILLTSCAGGINLDATYELQYEDLRGEDYVNYDINIHGLMGGHSGAEIHLGRANACVLMGQLLYVFVGAGVPFQLLSISGGEKNNAIPSFSNATIRIKESQLESIKIVLKDFVTRVAQEFAEREPNILVDLTKSEKKFDKAIYEYTKLSLVDAIAHVSDGVCRMSEDIDGLVETSSNLGVIVFDESEKFINLQFLLRSSVKSELDKLVSVIIFVLRKGVYNHVDDYSVDEGIKVMPFISTSNEYPGWAYKEDSKLRELVMDVYNKQYGKPMKAEGIHAGLECGIFADKADFDIVSLGPDILDIHTPRETLKVASTKRTYELLLEVLRRADELS
ncbi:MAG: aminoacyl-histidine dipeptidase [Lachnospiraceae bacterium]|nr:aminoacyl-histidine dipeptidase [Lachnospiraceae bacterium]